MPMISTRREVKTNHNCPAEDVLEDCCNESACFFASCFAMSRISYCITKVPIARDMTSTVKVDASLNCSCSRVSNASRPKSSGRARTAAAALERRGCGVFIPAARFCVIERKVGSVYAR